MRHVPAASLVVHRGRLLLYQAHQQRLVLVLTGGDPLLLVWRVPRKVLQRNYVAVRWVATPIASADGDSVSLFSGRPKSSFPSLHIATNTALDGE